MHTLAGHSFLVQADADPVEVRAFEGGFASSFIEPDHRFVRTDAGWIDENGDRVSPELASELSNLLLPEEGNNQPLYGMNPSPLTGLPGEGTDNVLEDPLLAHDHGDHQH